MTAVPAITTRAPRQRRQLLAQTRYRLLILGAVAFILALITLLQAVHAYSTAYEVFRGIVEVNSTTVNASEAALQYIAQASQAAADYALLSSSTPLYEQAQNNIFRDFSSFRDQMFILRGNLQTAEEHTAFTAADTFVYSRFWRHISDLVAQRSNDTEARKQYLFADDHLRTWINPALQDLENLNFQQMEQAGDQAGSTITVQVILLAIPAIALALLLTYLSFMLRRKVHRYLTPGIDLAVIISWGLLLAMLITLLNAPHQLNVMIQDAYRSVSGSSRVLVEANQANRAESSALLDQERADAWFTRFDTAYNNVELLMCGKPGCTQNTFVGAGDQPNTQVVAVAQSSTRNNTLIPLIGNITFSGELQALEQARVALQDFKQVDTNLRQLIQAKSIPDAITLNTSTDAGTSQADFDQFVSAMTNEREINRAVFDQVWQSESGLLLSNQMIYGFVGYALIGVLMILGVYHRFREL